MIQLYSGKEEGIFKRIKFNNFIESNFSNQLIYLDEDSRRYLSIWHLKKEGIVVKYEDYIKNSETEVKIHIFPSENSDYEKFINLLEKERNKPSRITQKYSIEFQSRN